VRDQDAAEPQRPAGRVAVHEQPGEAENVRGLLIAAPKDAKNSWVVSAQVNDCPSCRRFPAREAVLSQTTSSTTPSGMPTPGANVDMPKITDTNVIAIMSDASEKLPAVARSSRWR